jgi:hypothetical protein
MEVRARGEETHAFHGPTEWILPISNLHIRRFPRTMLRFPYGAHSKSSYDSLMGLEERANVGRLFATDHLQCMLSVGQKRTEHRTTNVGSCLLYLRAGAE